MFLLVETISDDQVFSVYLGNIPGDVILEEVWINRKQLMMAKSVERGISISPVVHVNGSQAYKLRLPFEDAVVHWTVRTPYRTRITFFWPVFGSGSSCLFVFILVVMLLDQSGSTAVLLATDQRLSLDLVLPPELTAPSHEQKNGRMKKDICKVLSFLQHKRIIRYCCYKWYFMFNQLCHYWGTNYADLF